MSDADQDAPATQSFTARVVIQHNDETIERGKTIKLSFDEFTALKAAQAIEGEWSSEKSAKSKKA